MEILSPSTSQRDRSLKFDLYARVGVAEDWIADSEEREVVRYVVEDDGWQAGRHHDEISFASGAVSASVHLTAVWPS